MTQFRRLARGSTLASAVACAFVAVWTGMSCVGNAKDTKAATAQSEKDSKKAEARKAYDAGLKAFANGRNQPAVDQLSAALKSGGLSSTEMAKALYTRGVAYKRLKQPGPAISDLTSALWLKNGLSDSDREKATAERAEAYKAAGIQDTGKGPERVIAAAPASSGANASSAGLSAAAIAQAAAQNAKNSNSTPGSPATRQDGNSLAAQEAARARASYAPVNSLAGSTVKSGTAQTVSSSAAPGTSFGSGVSGFFSNLFGGSSSAPASPADGVTTASTSPTVSETSSWSSATVVNEGHAASQMSHVSVHEPKAKAHATKGKYKVHIAALRSEAEAEALAQKIVAQHGADLDNHVPTVDKAVIGSMGTFYRVRIGGYASRDEPSGLCTKLRTSGLDCLVVTN